MTNILVVGTQWGDEGKAKIIDFGVRNGLYGIYFDVVARFQGGNNAGHTQQKGKDKYIFHLVPSGIRHDGIYNVDLHGVFIDPLALEQEIYGLRQKGCKVSPENFGVSGLAHVTLDFHKKLEAMAEKKRKKRIGTTMRGIGPTAVYKYGRLGIRFSQFIGDRFYDALSPALEEAGDTLGEKLDPAYYHEKYDPVREFLSQFLVNEQKLIEDIRKNEKNVLLEGAQGTMLDINVGTYPYVTSSSTIKVPLETLIRCGVIKAYTTRVGMGPFPTEIEEEELQNLIREIGNEFGATTGRKRRCGWFDGVVAKYAVTMGSINSLAVTKLDVLDTIDPIKVCTGYRYKGDKIDFVPEEGAIALEECEPIYREMKGWVGKPSSGAREPSDLHRNARDYLELLSDLAGCKIGLVSVGPEAEQTFEMV